METVRKAALEDRTRIFDLYQAVAAHPGGLARIQNEISISYVKGFLEKSLATGLILVIENTNQKILAEIHAYKNDLKVFEHVLGDLTITVHPDFQGKKLGKKIFTQFLDEVAKNRSDVMRVELIARESNRKAIEFYERIGFKIEGRFENRIRSVNGGFEADIPMAWMNPNYKNR